MVSTSDSSLNYNNQIVKGTWPNIAAVRVESNASFTLTEMALQGDICVEWATVDMQQVYSVSMIRYDLRM